MIHPSIHLRIEPKLLKLLEKEAKKGDITVQELVRRIVKLRYARKARAHPLEYEDYFAGKPRRAISSFEDYFSEKK